MGRASARCSCCRGLHCWLELSSVCLLRPFKCHLGEKLCEATTTKCYILRALTDQPGTQTPLPKETMISLHASQRRRDDSAKLYGSVTAAAAARLLPLCLASQFSALLCRAMLGAPLTRATHQQLLRSFKPLSPCRFSSGTLLRATVSITAAQGVKIMQQTIRPSEEGCGLLGCCLAWCLACAVKKVSLPTVAK